MRHCVRTGLRSVLLLLCAAPLLSALPAAPESHPAAVTLVARPWAEASLDDGEPFIVPATVLLEPGAHRLRISRRGYQTFEIELRVEGRQPQHHLYLLERQ